MKESHSSSWFAPYASDVTSQHGEDGLIAEIFRRVGASNKWCVEFGALNGTHHSNTWDLIKNKNWSGVLIEADPTYAEKLQKVYADTPQAHCFNELVELEGEHALDSILARTDIPKDFDLLSVDIDGNDYHAWDSLKKYSPRLVVIEFNPTIPNDISFIQPADMSVQQGSSLRALQTLGEKKGYTLVAVLGVNGFFLKKELVEKLQAPAMTLDELYTETKFYTRLFQLYDGTLVLDGNRELLWHHRTLSEEDVQAIPARRRRYPSGVSSNALVRSIKYLVRKSPLYPLIRRIRS